MEVVPDISGRPPFYSLIMKLINEKKYVLIQTGLIIALLIMVIIMLIYL